MKDEELRSALFASGIIYKMDIGTAVGSKIIVAPELHKKLNALTEKLNTLMDYMGLEFDNQPEQLIVKSKNKGFVEEKK